VSNDQFESSVSGYKAQQTGKPTTSQSRQLLNLSSLTSHSTGGAEAKSAKHNFERIPKESEVQVKAYRAHNGIFEK
jgi:hypothetical protein